MANMSIMISAYFGMALFLSQFLHSYYVKRDPKYKGNLAIGLPYFNVGSVNYKYGYLTAFIILFSGFFITFSLLSLIPSIEGSTFGEFFISYGRNVLLALFAIYLFAQVVGPSASKLFIDGIAMFMVMVIIYSSTKDANFSSIIGPMGVIASISYALAGKWICDFQRDRVRKYGVKHVYFIPTFYMFGSLTFNWVVGIMIALTTYLG